MNNPKVATPIVDKNGKNTTVHKKVAQQVANSRVGGIGIPSSAGAIPTTGTMRDGSSYVGTGDVEIVAVEDNYVFSHMKRGTRLHYHLGKNSSLRIDINRAMHSDSTNAHAIVPAYAVMERDARGDATMRFAYEAPIQRWADMIDPVIKVDEEGARHVLGGFFAGRFNARIESGDDGKEYISIPITREYMREVDVLSDNTEERFAAYASGRYGIYGDKLVRDLASPEHSDIEADIQRGLGVQ